MKPAPFAYAKARSLDHAIALLDGAPDARVLAGGQSLVAALNMRLSTPSLLVDINGLRELGEMSRRNGHIEIGALVRHAQAERSSAIAQFAPLLARAVPHIAHPAIRNRGTIGGSIVLADPAAELPACLLALGAEIELTGRTGRRSVAADEFSKGLFETAIEPGDLLTAIRVPVPRSGARFGFAELARRHGDYALVGLAAAATLDGGRLGDVRLAFFGVGDARPVRAGLKQHSNPATSTRRYSTSTRSFAAQRCARQRRNAAPFGRRAVATRYRPTGLTHMTDRVRVALTVNGDRVSAEVEPRQNLVDFLREELQLTGTHVGCEHGVCGACTVRVDGAIVRGCLMLAVQCDGAVVETIEGLSDSGDIADLQAAFRARNALQCGFCTPGILLTAQELLTRSDGAPSRDQIREHLSGNYCRCTGYQAIVDAIEAVASARQGQAR